MDNAIIKIEPKNDIIKMDNNITKTEPKNDTSAFFLVVSGLMLPYIIFNHLKGKKYKTE